MKITQIAPYVNEAFKQTLGESAVATDDLSNIVDMGTAVENADLTDTFIKGLMNQIGKMVFVDRPYSGIAPNVLMDGTEYGSVIAKISTDMPEAQEDQSWSLTDGSTYPPVYYAQEAHTKLFNGTNPYEFRRTVIRDQIKQNFRSADEMDRWFSMTATQVENAKTSAIDNTIRATINNFIGETLHSEFTDGNYAGKTGVKAVNLLYLYNQRFGTELTAEKAFTDPEFIRYAIFIINLVRDRMRGINTLYNIGKQTRFTTADRLHTVMLSTFADAAGVFLYDGQGQFRTDNLSLGTIDKVPYWQGIGTGFDENLGWVDASSINVKTSNNNEVSASGIVAVAFDREALGVCNKREKVTVDYSGAGDFWTYYYKNRAQYFNDFNEQFVVFYVA